MSSKYLAIVVFLLLAPIHVLAEPATTQAKPAEIPAKSAANIYESAVQSLGLDLENLRLTAKRGDVLMAFMEPPTRLNGGPNAHCGIMGDECKVYTNNWNTGIWCVAPYENFFYYYKDVRLLRFEESGGTARK